MGKYANVSSLYFCTKFCMPISRTLLTFITKPDIGIHIQKIPANEEMKKSVSNKVNGPSSAGTEHFAVISAPDILPQEILSKRRQVRSMVKVSVAKSQNFSK